MRRLDEREKIQLSFFPTEDGAAYSDRVFRDMPILVTASQLHDFTPPRCREMRQLVKSARLRRASDAEIFYEQGKFMADFEDDYAYTGDFERYFPTYQAMNDAQLRGYFSWRTKVRRGNVERTALSFAFVYVYELLNNIGVASPEEGFRALLDFYRAYGALDAKICRYVRLWLKDYVVYYGLDRALLAEVGEGASGSDLLTLLRADTCSEEAVFAALNAMSSYPLDRSAFYARRPDELRAAVVRTARMLLHDESFTARMFGSQYFNVYPMFRSAVFFDRMPPRSCRYEVNEIETFICEKGTWWRARFFRYSARNRMLGMVMKNVDCAMRKAYGFRSIRPEPCTKEIAAHIDAAVADTVRRGREAARPVIEIDTAKLGPIRAAALQTQNRLLTEEERDSVEPPSALAPPGGDGLSPDSRALLQRLLEGEDCAAFLAARGQMLSVAVDALNEQLYDLFGDTAVVFEGERPVIVEDYREDLKGLIRL